MIRLSAAAILAALVLAIPAEGANRERRPMAGAAGLSGLADGSLVQNATGLRFPGVGYGFKRTSAEALDAAGKSTVVSYERATPNGQSVARIAVVEINDMSALEHFAGMSPIVGTYFGKLHFKDIKPVSDGPLNLNGVAPRNAWQGHFTATLDGRPYLLSLSTLDMGRYAGRVTAAYPRRDAKDVQQRLYALVAQIRATGPKHTHKAL